jgi:phosphocarrier protein
VYARQVTVWNKSGLHARPAANFVREAVKFKSSIKIARMSRPEASVNGKSLVLVLSLSVECNGQVEISAEGEDEQAAVDALVAIVNAGLGEEG